MENIDGSVLLLVHTIAVRLYLPRDFSARLKRSRDLTFQLTAFVSPVFQAPPNSTKMATVVPISHCRRYRSRSRTASVESTPSLPRTSSTGSFDSDSDSDEEWLADSPQSSPGLVMPFGFASPEARPRVVTPLGTTYLSTSSWVLADPKSMERRRAIESRD